MTTYDNMNECPISLNFTTEHLFELEGCFAPFWKPKSKVFQSLNDKKIEFFLSKKVIGCFIFRRFVLILFLIDHPLYFDR